MEEDIGAITREFESLKAKDQGILRDILRSDVSTYEEVVNSPSIASLSDKAKVWLEKILQNGELQKVRFALKNPLSEKSVVDPRISNEFLKKPIQIPIIEVKRRNLFIVCGVFVLLALLTNPSKQSFVNYLTDRIYYTACREIDELSNEGAGEYGCRDLYSMKPSEVRDIIDRASYRNNNFIYSGYQLAQPDRVKGHALLGGDAIGILGIIIELNVFGGFLLLGVPIVLIYLFANSKS